MKEFEIWMEGFITTGQRGTAKLIGIGEGETFDDAVKEYMSKNPGHGIYDPGRNGFTTDEAYDNRDSNWRVWGCSLYDNQLDASKAFG